MTDIDSQSCRDKCMCVVNWRSSQLCSSGFVRCRGHRYNLSFHQSLLYNMRNSAQSNQIAGRWTRNDYQIIHLSAYQHIIFDQLYLKYIQSQTDSKNIHASKRLIILVANKDFDDANGSLQILLRHNSRLHDYRNRFCCRLLYCSSKTTTH